METIKNVFKPIMKEGNSQLKHIDYKTFNSIQQVNNSDTEVRYNFLQGKVAAAVRKISFQLVDSFVLMLTLLMTRFKL